MQAILLLLSFVSEFIASETGFVRQRDGLPVAWAAGVLVAAAILFGMPEKVHAACGWGPSCTPGVSDCGQLCFQQVPYCNTTGCALYSPGVYRCYCPPF